MLEAVSFFFIFATLTYKTYHETFFYFLEDIIGNNILCQ
jgi:hypothetical protein